MACLEASEKDCEPHFRIEESFANPPRFTHYLELGEIRAAFRRSGNSKDGPEILNSSSLNQSIDAPLAKDYDAVAELEVENFGIGSQLNMSDP